MTLAEQLVWLFVLAIPIASVAWTVTHEEVFAEPRHYCVVANLYMSAFGRLRLGIRSEGNDIEIKEEQLSQR